MTAVPPEELEQFLPSLLRRISGWFADHTLHRTTVGRRGCNRRASWPTSLRLCRWRFLRIL
jgi:hypothetical protein